MNEPTPKRPAEPENAPGAFYVEQGCCIICMLPVETAPQLIGFHDDSANGHVGSHCYFARQPESPGELDAAIEAVFHACCGALRYCGTDRSVIRRLLSSDNADSVDYPSSP